MVQESTMICVDNSDWMRNGDFPPTRLQCLQDAANLVTQCKIRANPENAVGILAMADQVEVLSSMTQETNRLFMKLHSLEPRGRSRVLPAIKVAHLALKHRQNRNHKMRIVVFIGSPIEDVDANELTRVAKKLKKEKVQVDVVLFGDAESNATNSEIMGSFIDTLNGREGSGSNLVVVPSGAALTEALVGSAVCRGEDGAAPAVVAGAGGGFEFGVDPEDDPDLALALRVSLEEQRARQQAEAAAEGRSEAGGTTGGTAAAAAGGQIEDIMDMDMGAMTEEQQLEWALRMSLQDSVMPQQQSAPTNEASSSTSLAITQPMDTSEGKGEEKEQQLDDLIEDPELLQQIINQLPDEKKKDQKPTGNSKDGKDKS